MATPVCELCGCTDFIKEDGMFVCQGCNTKYTLEEARKLMHADSSSAAPVHDAGNFEPQNTGDFDPQALQSNAQDARVSNNYICKGFCLLLDEYKSLDHPSKVDADKLVANAKSCLALLDAAAQINPSDHVANLLIFKNCVQIEDAVRRADYYEKSEDGQYRSHSLFTASVRPSSLSASWNEKIRYHRDFLEQEFVDLYTLEWQRKLELEAQARALQADIDSLKEEKRSKGLFNFAEKREVKDRMKPFKDELASVQAQIRDIERKVDAFVEEKLKALEGGYTRLQTNMLL